MAVVITALINTQARGPIGPAGANGTNGTDAEVTAAAVQTALAAGPKEARESIQAANVPTGPWADDFDAENAGVAAGALYKQPAGVIAWRENTFDPADLTPLFWLDASLLTLSEAANVTSVPDLSGNGRTATNSGTAPVFDAEGPNGMPWILSAARTLITASFQQWPSKRGTWFVVYVPDTTPTDGVNFLGSHTGTSPTWIIYNNADAADRYFYSGAFGTSPQRLQNDIAGQIVVKAVRRSSDTAFQYFRNVTRQWDFTLADHQPAANPLKIGNNFNGRIGEIIGFAEALTDAQVKQVSAYLTRKWTGGRPINLHFEGDSQTAGANLAADADTMPFKVFSALASSRVAIRSHAVSGNAWTNLEGRASAVDALLSDYARNILVVWCGTNEAGANDAPSSIAAATSYLADRAAAGWDLVVLTAMDRTDASNETWRTAYNNGLRALCVAEGYHLADIAADPNIGGAGDYADTTYFQVDGIHLNATGMGVAAGIVAPIITPLITP